MGSLLLVGAAVAAAAAGSAVTIAGQYSIDETPIRFAAFSLTRARASLAAWSEGELSDSSPAAAADAAGGYIPWAAVAEAVRPPPIWMDSHSLTAREPLSLSAA